MSDSRISSLLEIAEKQLGAQLALLNRRQADLDLLLHQQRDLVKYYHSCKQGLIDADGELPVLLSHRLRFISALAEQCRELDTRIEAVQKEVSNYAKLWRKRVARQQALEAIAIQQHRRQLLEANRREQKDLEEVSRMTQRSADADYLTQGCENV